jgi:hypothetical protein
MHYASLSNPVFLVRISLSLIFREKFIFGKIDFLQVSEQMKIGAELVLGIETRHIVCFLIIRRLINFLVLLESVYVYFLPTVLVVL